MARPGRLHAAFSGLAVALIAAAIGNPLVESIANAGFFGRGYADDDHQSVVPVLALGALLVLVLVSRLIARALHSAEHAPLRSPQRLLRLVVAATGTTASPRMVTCAYAAQLASVDLMERCEHLWSGGAAVHGLSWLGGPPPAALLVHLALLLGCAFLVRRASRAMLASALATLCAAFERAIAARERAAARPLGRRMLERFSSRYELVVARRLRGRAPPLRIASV